MVAFTILGSGVWEQITYEDVQEKVQRYGNYVLDDIAQAFRESDIHEIDMTSYADNFSIIRIKFAKDNFGNGKSDVSYSVEYAEPLHNITQHLIYKNDQPIHKWNDSNWEHYEHLQGYNGHSLDHHYNEFENANYIVTIASFKCTKLPGNIPKYQGLYNTNQQRLKDAVYVVDLEIEIHKIDGDSPKYYDTVNFNRTVFVSDAYNI